MTTPKLPLELARLNHWPARTNARKICPFQSNEDTDFADLKKIEVRIF
jgi:hypothetical protein